MARITDYTKSEWESAAKKRGITVQEAQRRYLEKNPEPGAAKRGEPEPRGVPFSVRMSMGAGGKPEDRLATLRQWYPTAQPYGDGNFEIQGSQGPYLYNPPGFDIGDVGELLPRMTGETLGGVVGGTAGLLAGPGAPVAVPAMAGAGAEIGGTISDIGASLLGRQDTRAPLERLPGQTANVALETLGQKYGPEAVEALRRAWSSGMNRLAGRPPAGVVADLAEMGAPVPGALAATTGDRPLSTLVENLAHQPGSARVMSRVMGRTFDAIEQEWRRVIRGFGAGPTSKEAVAEQIQFGSAQAKNRFQQEMARHNRRVSELVPDDWPGSTEALRTLRARYAQMVEQAPNARGYLDDAIEAMDGYLEDANSGGWTFRVIRDAREDLGQNIKFPGVERKYLGKRGQAMNDVYDALRADILNTADNVSDDALRAMRQRDAFISQYKQAEEPILNEALKKDVDKVFAWAKSGVKGGGDRIRRLRGSMAAEEWDDVASGYLYQLGRVRGGQGGPGAESFSMNTFLTNWNDMDPMARKAMWGGTRYQDLWAPLNRLARVSGAFRLAERQGMNVSKTAAHNFWNNLFSGSLFASGGAIGYAVADAPGAAVGMTMPVVAPWATARLLTSPKFVRWLTRAYPDALNYNAMSGHLARLMTTAKADPELLPALEEFTRGVTAAYTQNEQQNGN